MNVNLSSVLSSYSSARTTQTQRTGPTDADKAKMFADMDSDGDGSISKSEFDAFKPSGTPSQFNVQRSTSQLAQQSGHGGPGGPGGAGGPPPGPPPGGMGGAGGAGNDPIQSLDSNSDGSVSSDEFGLSSASDTVKKLYAAIDSNSDGALSTDEISSFRAQMQAQMNQGQSPMGPPPQDASSSSSSDRSTAMSTSSSTSTHSSHRPDASEMIRMIAARYAEMSGNSSTSTSAATQSLSVTA
ncbi:hypothetical protein [Sphaerotilus sp.]|uniref:hypothetical protein n=1 Tax=Sphaerotilus sp. TaxID=2093942 RepID=UPI0034E1C263